MRGGKWGMALVVALAIGGQGCGGCSKPPPVQLDLPEKSGPLVFPVPDEGWLDRAPVERVASTSNDEVRVTEPSLDANGHFEINGQKVTIDFSEEVFAEKDLKTAPRPTLVPNVPGRTTWTSPREMEFRADHAFDIDTDYTISLPELTSPKGKKLTGGFKATFRAKPDVAIAGKIIHWYPKPGEPRPIYVRPWGEVDIGPAQEILVIFDQVIELPVAAKLLVMSDAKGQKIPLTLSQLPRAQAFEGEKVDTQSIVIAKMATAPAPDTKLSFQAHSADAELEPVTREFHIPKLPKVKTFGCQNPKECTQTGTTFRGPVSTTLSVDFTNRVRWRDLEKHITVTPVPPKLRISGWGEDAQIDAAWVPATTYQIRSSGLGDRFGLPIPDFSFTFITAPRTSTAILREGVMVLDEAGAKDFFVTTRNVKKGELLVWNVPPGADALTAAVEAAKNNDPPTKFGEPRVIAFDGIGEPHTYAKSPLDLWGKLEPGHAYLAQVRIKESANGAVPSDATSTYGSRPSVPLFLVAGKDTVGAHVHRVDRKALISIFRLATGEPVAGASVGMGTGRTITDDQGIAELDVPERDGADKVTVKVGAEETIIPLDRITTGASDFYPDLTNSEGEPERELIGVLVTDRGIYRPGSTIFVKGHVRKPEERRIAAAPQAKVRLRVTDATGADIVDEAMLAGPNGTITKDVVLPKSGRTGKHRIRLEVDDTHHTVLAEESVRVAEFEAPRFKVDIEAPADMPDGHWKSRVAGHYFFGAPMDGGTVEWTLKKKLKKLDAKKLEDAGFSFGRETNPFDSTASKPEERPRTGEGKLSAEGTFDVDTEVWPLLEGPTEVTFEADVSDSSYRHVAGKKSVVRHPFPHYAGVRLKERFGALGSVKIDLVAVDKDGKTVAGVPMEARLERLEWKKSSAKAESGATVESWGNVAIVEGTCSIASDVTAKGCEVPAKHWGEYRVTARVDGRDDATTSFYAWGGDGYGWGGDGGGSAAVPSSGKRIPINADKKSYAPGDTAKVLVQSPFPEAMAVLTLERGGLIKHEARRIKGPSTVFDVPLTLAQAPYAHAVVTLLPIGGPEVAYRVGAVRLPVSLDSARLTVHVTSAKKSYDIRETAEITVEVRRGNEPVKNADVTLAVVEEGILRLTDFHAKDPTNALHPPRALNFTAADSRELLFRRREKAHVAGGGGADDSDSVDTRRNFVETAAWVPSLVTDGSGRATTSVKLPDNLTEFRMLATVVGEDGSAGANEESFVVTRPFLLDPILPSFALEGDQLEIAAMAHNNTDRAVDAKVRVMDVVKSVRLGAHGHERVSIPFTAKKTVSVEFALDVDGKTRDRVEKSVRVGLPGTEEHPQLSGVFLGNQEITLAVPEDAIFEEGAKLTLRTGAALYPELGQRLTYLTGYPHGCVEQTTSSTLPLLAAKNLLPWTGVPGLDDVELRKRIDFGVQRLATMKTVQGGLAYWPGGTDPHLYGTVYATRALLRAKEIGIEAPGLLPEVLKYLEERLPMERNPVLRVSIAEVLAQAGVLKPESADSLYDVREKLDPYGLGSLALALSVFPNETARMNDVLDRLEKSFDGNGVGTGVHDASDYSYWGSEDRDRAQALIALGKLRRTSRLPVVLAHRLIRNVERYTTQSTAWSLMAVSSFVGTDQPNGSVDVKIRVTGAIYDTTRRIGGDNKEVEFAMKDLRGKKVHLVLEGDGKTPCAFAMEARYVRPDATSTRHARRAALGPSVYRVYTTPTGAPIDLANVKAGDIVRVALRIEVGKLDTWRATYLAVTDRFPAGFQPVQPDLATVASVPDLQAVHPFYQGLTGWGGSASHVDVRDDRVNVYFDSIYGGRVAYASYLLRATTPGAFVLPSARAELMYEPGSEGYSDAGHVTVK